MPIPPAGRSGRGNRWNAATGKPDREGNKKPGDLAAHPGSDGLPAITGSLEGLLRSVRARIRLAWRDGLSLLLESQMPVHRISIHIRSPNAVLAAALTLQKQKARSARAVRASDGRWRLRDLRLQIGVSTKSCRSLRVHVPHLSKWARIVVLKKAKSIPICWHGGCDRRRGSRS
jgi:hypothetical protein